jgi:hypothetical protein
MKIVNGRIETPKRVVDRNGVRMKRLNTVEPPIPPFFKYLQPEDQRKLMELRRRGIVVDPPVKPEVKPTAQPNQ